MQAFSLIHLIKSFSLLHSMKANLKFAEDRIFSIFKASSQNIQDASQQPWKPPL